MWLVAETDADRLWTDSIQTMISDYLLPTVHSVIDDVTVGEEEIHQRLEGVSAEIRVIRKYLGELDLNDLMKSLSTEKSRDGEVTVDPVRRTSHLLQSYFIFILTLSSIQCMSFPWLFQWLLG